MKSISINPLSALAGAGLLGLVLVATGAVQASAGATSIPLCTHGPVRIVGIPDPRTMLIIREGTPFVVPPGKILVVTALGAVTNGLIVALAVDGQVEMSTVANMPTASPGTVNPMPTGLTAAAGSTVEVQTGSIFGRAWGYLADA